MQANKQGNQPMQLLVISLAPFTAVKQVMNPAYAAISNHITLWLLTTAYEPSSK